MKSVAYVLIAMVMCASCQAEVQSASELDAPGRPRVVTTSGKERTPGSSPSAPSDEIAGNLASHPGVRASYWECVQSDERAAVEKSYCVSEEAGFQDDRLNAVYQRLTKRLNAERRALLLASQRSWLDFRAKDQALESSLFGSEQIENLQISEREMLRISDRADALEYFESISEE